MPEPEENDGTDDFTPAEIFEIGRATGYRIGYEHATRNASYFFAAVLGFLFLARLYRGV